MHQLKSQQKIQSKYKESDTSSLSVASSSVSTEVDYTTAIDPTPTREELDNMGDAEKEVSGKIDRNKESNLQMGVWKDIFLFKIIVTYNNKG